MFAKNSNEQTIGKLDMALTELGKMGFQLKILLEDREDAKCPFVIGDTVQHKISKKKYIVIRINPRATYNGGRQIGTVSVSDGTYNDPYMIGHTFANVELEKCNGGVE